MFFGILTASKHGVKMPFTTIIEREIERQRDRERYRKRERQRARE